MKVKGMLVTLFLILTVGLSSQAQTPDFSVDAVAGVLLDFDSGQVLFSQKGQEVRIPASLVKVMTMYVALDQISQGKINLSDEVIVSENSWRMGGSQMFLEVGERLTVEQLLYGISVVSGNDATVSIAEATAGTEQLFVRWMNDKARDLGLNLKYVDVHGLSEENQITAEDMALLAWHYLKDYPEALKYHQERSYSHTPRSSGKPIVQSNRNGLLWSYEGADGLKTGFLSKAGYNLVATATQNDRRLIAVVLGASNERVREAEVTKLLNFGFRSFELLDLNQLVPSSTVRVYKGQERNVTLVPAEKYISIPRGTERSLDVEVISESVEAPIAEGQPIGRVIVRLDGEVIKETPLLAENEVARGGFFRIAFDTIVAFFSKLISNLRRK